MSAADKVSSRERIAFCNLKFEKSAWRCIQKFDGEEMESPPQFFSHYVENEEMKRLASRSYFSLALNIIKRNCETHFIER